MSWQFEQVAGPYGGLTDGPVWDGEALLFTRQTFPANSIDNRILRYDPGSRQVTDFRRWTNRTTGLAFSADGVLYGCQSAGRRLVRFNQDGTTSPLAHKIGGLHHNQPKDLVVDRKGRIWFCDPHGNLREAFYPQIPDKLDHASILRLDAPDLTNSPIHRMTYDTDAPWAVLLSRDEDTLYVAESAEDRQGVRELRAYPILADDTLGPYLLLHTFGDHRGISGMCLDDQGNIVACAGSEDSGPGPLVYVFSPAGRILETHPLPAPATNCAFGDANGQSLYVTTQCGCLLRAAKTGRRGWALYPLATQQ